MHNLFVFGIGGTGARVIRALNMLLAANGGIYKDKDSDGNIINETRVIPIIIDYDVRNGDKLRAIETLNLYSRINKEIYGGNFNKDSKHPNDGFFSTEVREMREILKGQSESTFNLQYNPPSTAKKYSDCIGYSTLTGDLKSTQELLNTLYNTSSSQEVAELHIDTTVGFRGNPNIGSVMLNNLNKSKEFLEFSRICNGLNGDRVVIIGSLFGGTGSSGIPVLVNSIKKSERTGVNSAKIATVLVCPYFKVGVPEENRRHEGVIDDKIFESKTKAALYYYEDALNDKIDAIYYLGDRNKNTLPHHVGEEEQKNPAHIVELVSAMAVAHFNSTLEESFNRTTADGKRKIYWQYGFNADLDKETTLDFSMFADESMEDIKRLVSYGLAAYLLREFMIKNNKYCSDANFYKMAGMDKNLASKNEEEKKFQQTLDHFLEYFQSFSEWMGELEEGSTHNLVNFDFSVQEVCDILKTHPFRKEKRNLFGKVIKEPVLQPSQLFSEMSSVFKSLHMQGDKNKSLHANEDISYAFFHSLYEASVRIVNEKINLKRN